VIHMLSKLFKRQNGVNWEDKGVRGEFCDQLRAFLKEDGIDCQGGVFK